MTSGPRLERPAADRSEARSPDASFSTARPVACGGSFPREASATAARHGRRASHELPMRDDGFDSRRSISHRRTRDDHEPSIHCEVRRVHVVEQHHEHVGLVGHEIARTAPQPRPFQTDELGIDRADSRAAAVGALDRQPAVEAENVVVRAAHQIRGGVHDATEPGQAELRVIAAERKTEPTTLGPGIGFLLHDRPLQVERFRVRSERQSVGDQTPGAHGRHEPIATLRRLARPENLRHRPAGQGP